MRHLTDEEVKAVSGGFRPPAGVPVDILTGVPTSSSVVVVAGDQQNFGEGIVREENLWITPLGGYRTIEEYNAAARRENAKIVAAGFFTGATAASSKAVWAGPYGLVAMGLLGGAVGAVGTVVGGVVTDSFHQVVRS